MICRQLYDNVERSVFMICPNIKPGLYPSPKMMTSPWDNLIFRRLARETSLRVWYIPDEHLLGYFKSPGALLKVDGNTARESTGHEGV